MFHLLAEWTLSEGAVVLTVVCALALLLVADIATSRPPNEPTGDNRRSM